jgi:hypothetical protein
VVPMKRTPPDKGHRSPKVVSNHDLVHSQPHMSKD